MIIALTKLNIHEANFSTTERALGVPILCGGCHLDNHRVLIQYSAVLTHSRCLLSCMLLMENKDRTEPRVEDVTGKKVKRSHDARATR